MNFLHVNAGAAAPAWKTIALILLCLGSSLAWAGPSVERSLNGDVVVTVVADATWQAAYPRCTVHATAAECGLLPVVTVAGTDCFPAEGTFDLALVTVKDAPAACESHYLVQAVDGQVIIICIDEE